MLLSSFGNNALERAGKGSKCDTFRMENHGIEKKIEFEKLPTLYIFHDN